MYLCIDLKSFYASVECVERGLDPLKTNLVVADPERSEGTICLAITPPMKKLGIKNRCRVFQIPKTVEYIMAPPRMRLYLQYSAKIYGIYLQYAAKEDIHVYSVDEVFIDVEQYTKLYNTDAYSLAKRITEHILTETGITATCGIGTNIYLAKVALDIYAKKIQSNIAFLDEDGYKEHLWEHRPLTDFWRVGRGVAGRLDRLGITCMKEVAHADEDVLYKMFGIDAELLIDHSKGIEPVTIADIKKYRSKYNSLSNGQVLFRDYKKEEALIIIKEMAESLCMDMFDKGLVSGSITLNVRYSAKLEIKPDRGTITFPVPTNIVKNIMPYVVELFEKTASEYQPIRGMIITFNKVVPEEFEQLTLFGNTENDEKERRIQKATLDVRKKFGKNAIVKGLSLQDAATGMDRNRQIGGHKSE